MFYAVMKIRCLYGFSFPCIVWVCKSIVIEARWVFEPVTPLANSEPGNYRTAGSENLPETWCKTECFANTRSAELPKACQCWVSLSYGSLPRSYTHRRLRGSPERLRAITFPSMYVCIYTHVKKCMQVFWKFQNSISIFKFSKCKEYKLLQTL